MLLSLPQTLAPVPAALYWRGSQGGGRQRTEYFAAFRNPVLLFLYPEFSGVGDKHPVFMIKVEYLMIKVRLYKGFPLMYYNWGEMRRLLLKMRPSWSEI
jgi:hypothetical protein